MTVTLRGFDVTASGRRLRRPRTVNLGVCCGNISTALFESCVVHFGLEVARKHNFADAGFSLSRRTAQDRGMSSDIGRRFTD
jgi:hypothetical protein